MSSAQSLSANELCAGCNIAAGFRSFHGGSISLPSIPEIAKERGLDLTQLSAADEEELLVEAMRRDLPLATEFLHRESHGISDSTPSVSWLEDPNSVRGKQLIRLHASDALRPLASKHFCHGHALAFVNCCGGVIGRPPPRINLLQIQSQAGPVAYADC